MKKNGFVFCALLIAMMMSATNVMAQEATDLSKARLGETTLGAASAWVAFNTMDVGIRQPDSHFLANVEANLKVPEIMLNEAGKVTNGSAAKMLVHDAKVSAIHGARSVMSVTKSRGGNIARGVVATIGLAAVYDGIKLQGKYADEVSEKIGLATPSRPSASSAQ